MKLVPYSRVCNSVKSSLNGEMTSRIFKHFSILRISQHPFPITYSRLKCKNHITRSFIRFKEANG